MGAIWVGSSGMQHLCASLLSQNDCTRALTNGMRALWLLWKELDVIGFRVTSTNELWKVRDTATSLFSVRKIVVTAWMQKYLEQRSR